MNRENHRFKGKNQQTELFYSEILIAILLSEDRKISLKFSSDTSISVLKTLLSEKIK